jgi:hypothetical protein
MVERLSAAGQHIALPDAIMITGTDDHDPPETMITINWIERSRWSGIGDHDRPECAASAVKEFADGAGRCGNLLHGVRIRDEVWTLEPTVDASRVLDP